MDLDGVRGKLNTYDNIVRNIINLRMSLIPVVTDIKVKNNIPFYQGKREEEIYKRIEAFAKQNGVDSNLIKDIYKSIMETAVRIEEDIAKNPEKSVINRNVDLQKQEEIKKEFEKLDQVIEKELPEILQKISKLCEEENLKVNEVATLYYNNKVNE